jgi:hypothetical protein
MIVGLSDILIFSCFVAAGSFYRRSPEATKG